MNRDIAIICASPPGVNLGMDSVDLAFSYFAEKYEFSERVQFWQLYPANRPASTNERKRVSYSVIPLEDNFFQSKRTILYWGDFLHMRQYHEAVARKLVASGLCDSIESANLRVQNAFLQSDQNTDVLEKTLTFGSTLLFNTIQDEEHLVYRASLERFLKSCKAAWFRDVYSAFKASQIQGSFKNTHLGVDCATLINPASIRGLRNQPAENVVGIFLGRSTQNIQDMVHFAAEFAKAVACKTAWINWGDTSAFPFLSSISQVNAIRSLESFSHEPVWQPEEALSNLLKYRAIVTDTYHVMVNAWNLGVPAICLVEKQYSQTRNVNYGDYFARRDKREIFMSMYDALDFLVPIEEFENKELKNARILRLANLINSGKSIDSIQKRIRMHAESAESILMQELSSLL